MQVLGVSGSPSSPSKTALAIGTALDRAAEHDDVHTELLDLRGYDLVFSDGRDPADYTGDTRTVIDRVIAADALVIGTPMYRGGYTGRLKNLFDLLPNDALAGKPVGLIATGGTMLAGARLLRRLGADVVECAAIVDLPELGGSQRLRDDGLAVHALLDFPGH